MASLLISQQSLVTLVANFAETTVTAEPNSLTLGMVETRLELLKGYWSTLQTNHLVLVTKERLASDSYFTDNVFQRTEFVVTAALSHIYDEKGRLSATQQGAIRSTPTTLHQLPRINLHNFSGNQGDWESFRDLYSSLVHTNETLTNVQKFHHLKASLQGEAKIALDGVAITEANYLTAWKILLKRYDNKCLLVQESLSALISISELKTSVLAEAIDGSRIPARVLIDPGSEASFVSRDLVCRLGLSERVISIPISSIDGRQIETVRGTVILRLHSNHSSTSIDLFALVLRHLSIITPPRFLAPQKWPHLKGITLADSNFTLPRGIAVLLGADIYGSLLLAGVRQGKQGASIAQQTIFGWTIIGTVPFKDLEASSIPCVTSAVVLDSTEKLTQALERFWVQEEVSNTFLASPKEKQCERQFRESHKRDSTGRYIISLPFRLSTTLNLGSSIEAALQVLQSMCHRMERDSRLKSAYESFMFDYERLGHMRPIPPSQLTKTNNFSYYIPHHAIWRTSDGTPKLRVVFNASRPTSSGVSLNELVDTGPKLQADLSSVLLRWRFLRVAFCADIEMMYRQIRVDEQDVDLQRIVWKRPGDEEVTHYQLLTLTYGMSCSPYLAIRVLRQLADDEGNKFPAAVEIIRKNTYVDDILSGADNEIAAANRRDQLILLLKSGSFHLKKWASNSPSLLDDVPENDRLRPNWRQFETGEPISALGVAWDPIFDEFRFRPPSLHHLNPITKRTVLAAIARLFDPVVWLSPIIITAKVLMQDLWRKRLDWDEPLTPELAQRWHSFENSLSWISEIRCPRWIGACEEDTVEIHGFSDASKIAYAAVLFARVKKVDGSCTSRLLTTKTRVAPVKTLSIPRLELCAALLLSHLLRHTLHELKLSKAVVHAWSDSQIVLHWIQADDPSRWPTFIANRVSEIQQTLPQSVWHYVPSKENPADLATRGVSPQELTGLNLWWMGPPWMTLSEAEWPSSPLPSSEQVVINSEMTLSALVFNLMNTPDVLNRFSSFTRLQRTIAWCLRWLMLLKPSEERLNFMKTRLQPQELQRAFLCCVFWTQQHYFSEVLQKLQKDERLPTKDVLTRLNPFIDSTGVLRVGGRLSNSPLPYDQKHPVILPGNSHLANLLIDWEHQTALHGGFHLTYSLVMQRSWIIRGRVRVKAHIRKCITCARMKAKRAEQLMDDLPTERVTSARPFERSGLDYAGPFSLKTTKGRGIRTTKGYIALFVCLCTKAVHLEVVGDLTTDSFLAALRRFMGRRGLPKGLWSDNATTFRGADAELRSMLREAEIDWNLVQDTLTNQGVSWSFIPPSAPHFGGLWEAGVKTAKSHLKSIVGLRNLTYEEMSTLAVQVEMCMNSRPLIPIVGDPEDLDILTPGHALIGAPLLQFPEVVNNEEVSASNTHWRLVKNLRDTFWVRWSQDYLHTLQQRTKWTQPRTNLQPGNIVLIVDQSLTKFNRWPLGRVIAIYPGRDGLVRAAKIQTSNGTYDRPIHKLCLLPVQSDNDNN